MCSRLRLRQKTDKVRRYQALQKQEEGAHPHRIITVRKIFTGEAYSKMKDRLSLGSEMVPTLFIGKWTVKIVYSLKQGPRRHGQLRRSLRSVSQRMLTRTLRNLESAGLIARQVTRSKSLAVEYSLTKLGRTFIIPLSSICRWANRHKTELSAVASFSTHRRSGRSPGHYEKPAERR